MENYFMQIGLKSGHTHVSTDTNVETVAALLKAFASVNADSNNESMIGIKTVTYLPDGTRVNCNTTIVSSQIAYITAPNTE